MEWKELKEKLAPVVGEDVELITALKEYEDSIKDLEEVVTELETLRTNMETQIEEINKEWTARFKDTFFNSTTEEEVEPVEEENVEDITIEDLFKEGE